MYSINQTPLRKSWSKLACSCADLVHLNRKLLSVHTILLRFDSKVTFMLINFSRLKSVLLTGLYCGTFCVGTLVLQTAINNPAVGQSSPQASNSPAAGQPTAQQQEALKKQEELKKQVAEALFKELDNLVPGEQAEGSAAAESLHSAVDAVIDRKPAMALVILEEAVKSNPEFPPAELMMAGLFFAAKDQNSGIQYLRKAAIKNPGHPSVYAAYGRLASGANRNVDAKVHFEKLYGLLNQVQDKTALAHYENEYLEGMSQTALRLEQYDVARNLAGKLLERKPDNENALRLLARAGFDEGDLNVAVENLTKLREKNPKSRVPEAWIGTWFSQKGDLAKASTWFDKLPAAYPNDGTVQLQYAAWALQQGDVDAAATAITKVEALGAASEAANNLKGKIAFYQGKYGEAVTIFKALHEKNPGNSEITNLYILSLIESSTPENRTLANQLASLNMKANPNNRLTLATLGYVRLRTVGVNDQLKQVFGQLAKTMDARSPEVNYFLANFLRDAGNNKDALLVLQKALQYQGLFLYQKPAEQMKQALAASVGTTGVLPTPPATP